MALNVTWRMDASRKPPAFRDWEDLIRDWYGRRSGDVQIDRVFQAPRWRVSVASVRQDGPPEEGGRPSAPVLLDVRRELIELLRSAALPVDDYRP
jgi:hypothetical protein